MEYVVIKTGGKQYKVSIGDQIEVDKLPSEVNKSIYLSDVLLWVGDGALKIGKPLLEGARVKVSVLDQKRGDKIRVAKFKAKVRYRKVIGFRPYKTSLKVEAFEIPGTSTKTAKKETPKKASLVKNTKTTKQ